MEPMDRSAPVQVSEARLKELSSERHASRQQELGGSAVFNVWHRKWAGGDRVASRFASPFRCNTARDSGKTRSSGPFFCLWFARGCCHKGASCQYLHAVPSAQDAVRLSALNTTDCFGRSKFSSARDDMSGVGSFLHPCRTLHIGYFTNRDAKLTAKVKQQFAEWGLVTSVRTDKKQTMAFVTYASLSNAEFAKEAMSNQTLTGHETLSVKWARGSKHDENEIDLQRLRDVVRAALKKATRPTDSDATKVGSKRASVPNEPPSDPPAEETPQQPDLEAVPEPPHPREASVEPSAPPPRKRRGLVSYQ